jgi:hypothetical protein
MCPSVRHGPFGGSAAQFRSGEGRFILNVKALRSEASLNERRKLLLAMLDAVYFDTKQSNCIVAVRPPPRFKPIFQVAACTSTRSR